MLVVHDPTHGNTERITQAGSQTIGGQLRRVGERGSAELKGLNLLTVGSATREGFPTPGIDVLLRASSALHGVMVGAFDTRTKKTVSGYAAPRMAPPEDFSVLGIEGPLMDGEIELAAGWVKGVAEVSADRMRS